MTSVNATGTLDSAYLKWYLEDIVFTGTDPYEMDKDKICCSNKLDSLPTVTDYNMVNNLIHKKSQSNQN